MVIQPASTAPNDRQEYGPTVDHGERDEIDRLSAGRRNLDREGEQIRVGDRRRHLHREARAQRLSR